MFEFSGCAVAEFAAQALVFPPPHPFEGRELDLVDAAPWSALSDQFGFAQAVDRLGQGAIEGVPMVPVEGVAPRSAMRSVYTSDR